VQHACPRVLQALSGIGVFGGRCVEVLRVNYAQLTGELVEAIRFLNDKVKEETRAGPQAARAEQGHPPHGPQQGHTLHAHIHGVWHTQTTAWQQRLACRCRERRRCRPAVASPPGLTLTLTPNPNPNP